MLEKKSKLGALLFLAATLNIINALSPVSILKPVAIAPKGIPLKTPKKQINLLPKRIINLSNKEELALKNSFADLMKEVHPCFSEILSRAYNSYLISMGDKMRDLFPLSVSLSIDNKSSFSFTDDQYEIQRIYKNDPKLGKYLEKGMTFREQARLADFLEKQFLQISYRGPIFPTSVQSYIASSRLERNTKLKEALESMGKISEMIFELYSCSKSVSARKTQVGYLQKNLKDVKVRISVGSASEIDLIEAKESLSQYESKLDQDSLKVANLRRRCQNHNIDADKLLNVLDKIADEVIASKKIDMDKFIKNFENSVKFNVLKEEYFSSKLNTLGFSISTFAPTLDLSANFGSSSREFNFGMKMEGIRFGQFMKAIGQREKAAHNYNHSLKNLYGEFIDSLNTYEFLFKKHKHLLNSLINDTKIRKSMQSIVNDAALKDSNRKISESDVLKSKLSEEEARINLMNCRGDILKQGFQVLLSLLGEKDLSDMFKNSKGKTKVISLKDLKEEKLLLDDASKKTKESPKPILRSYSRTIRLAKKSNKRQVFPQKEAIPTIMKKFKG